MEERRSRHQRAENGPRFRDGVPKGFGSREDFHANPTYYFSPTYQEREARDDFIDRFFIALGWDVKHDTQRNPFEQEVKVERSVSVGGGRRRADYAFHVSPNFRDPRFIVEAKKPARDIATADNYFQTIRYGWGKGTPLAVLTDFANLHLLDCRSSWPGPGTTTCRPSPNSLGKRWSRSHWVCRSSSPWPSPSGWGSASGPRCWQVSSWPA